MKNQSKFVRATFRTILTFAIFHLSYLAVIAIWKGDLNFISLATILDLDIILKNSNTGIVNFLIGIVVIAIVFSASWTVTKSEDALSGTNA